MNSGMKPIQNDEAEPLHQIHKKLMFEIIFFTLGRSDQIFYMQVSISIHTVFIFTVLYFTLERVGAILLFFNF